MKKTIRVIGTGKISVKADLTILTLKSKGQYADYEQTLSKSAEATKLLKEVLSLAGLKADDLKTETFYIDTAYESYTDKNGYYKKKFIGYKYYNVSTIKFPADNIQLGRTLYSLATSSLDVEFSIAYTTSNPELAKNKLLEGAVKDSMAKAEILAKAAGVSLGEVVKIDYSWGDIRIQSNPMDDFYLENSYMKEDVSSYEIEVDPEDIDLSDTVTIEWEIH